LGNLGFKQVVAAFLIAILLIYMPMPELGLLSISEAHASSSEEQVDRAKLLVLYMLAVALTDIPVNETTKYELFHTAYVYKNGTIVLEDSPYIPGEELENVAKTALEVREKIESGEITYNQTEEGIDIYINGSLVLSIVEGNETCWHLRLGELNNKTLNENTVMYWRWVEANISGAIIKYELIYLVANVSDTHKVY